LVRIGADNVVGRGVRLSNLKEWMRVGLFSFTFITVVKVRTDTAFVSNTGNRLSITTIASNGGVNLLGLIGLLLAQVVAHKSLEGLSSVTVDFFSEHLGQLLVEGASQLTSSVASSARKTLLIDFLTVASPASHRFFIVH